MPSVGEGTGSVVRAAVTAGDVVSRVTLSGADGMEMFPATSVSVAVMALTPSFSGVVAVINQAPPVTVAVPIWVLPSSSVTVVPVVPRPLKTGRATLVMLSVLDDPLSDGASMSGVLGAVGAMVSRVTLSEADAAEMLPARSV